MHQSLSGLFLPLSVSPARPRRTFGYTVGWPFSARGFRRFPFCCYRTPGFRRILFPFSFSFRPGFRPSFPFSFFPGCECHLTHWSPEPGQRVVPPFLRWFHTASVVSRPRSPCSTGQASACPSLFQKYQGCFIPFQGCLFKKQALAC